MIITPLFRKLKEPLIISQKLGLEVSNVDKDNKKYLLQQLVFELEQYNKNVSIQYQVKTLKEILLSEYYVDTFNSVDLTSEIQCLKSICDNILMIYITDSQESMLSLKNQDSFNPTCEMSVEEKFIRFCSFLESHKPFETKYGGFDNAFNDNKHGSYSSETDIIWSMSWRVAPLILEKNNPYRYTSHNAECKHKVNSILAYGKLVDKYILSNNDFFAIDYIMDSLSTNEEIGATQVVRMTSILEFLIAKNDYKSLRYELRKKLPQFLSDSIDDKDRWITMMYDIRSKIAHGDYLGLMHKADKYAENFMKEHIFDYYELNRLNWIVSHINCELSSAIARIIRTMLNVRPIITKIKES